MFVSAQPRQAGSSYLPCWVKGSVSNIHGCEAIKSWCDYRGMINARTQTSKNIHFYSKIIKEKSTTAFKESLMNMCQTAFFPSWYILTTLVCQNSVTVTVSVWGRTVKEVSWENKFITVYYQWQPFKLKFIYYFISCNLCIGCCKVYLFDYSVLKCLVSLQFLSQEFIDAESAWNKITEYSRCIWNR